MVLYQPPRTAHRPPRNGGGPLSPEELHDLRKYEGGPPQIIKMDLLFDNLHHQQYLQGGEDQSSQHFQAQHSRHASRGAATQAAPSTGTSYNMRKKSK